MGMMNEFDDLREEISPELFQPLSGEEKEERWEGAKDQRLFDVIMNKIELALLIIDNDGMINRLETIWNFAKQSGISDERIAWDIHRSWDDQDAGPRLYQPQVDALNSIFGTTLKVRTNEATEEFPEIFKPASEEELDRRPISYDMIMYAIGDYINQHNLGKKPYQPKIRAKRKHFITYLRKRFGRWPEDLTQRVLKIADKQWDLKLTEAIDPSLFQPYSAEELSSPEREVSRRASEEDFWFNSYLSSAVRVDGGSSSASLHQAAGSVAVDFMSFGWSPEEFDDAVRRWLVNDATPTISKDQWVKLKAGFAAGKVHEAVTPELFQPHTDKHLKAREEERTAKWLPLKTRAVEMGMNVQRMAPSCDGKMVTYYLGDEIEQETIKKLQDEFPEIHIWYGKTWFQAERQEGRLERTEANEAITPELFQPISTEDAKARGFTNSEFLETYGPYLGDEIGYILQNSPNGGSLTGIVEFLIETDTIPAEYKEELEQYIRIAFANDSRMHMDEGIEFPTVF